MLSGVIRRTVPRRASAASSTIDWAKLLAKYEGEEKAELVSLKAHVASVESKHEQFSTPPAPIDWASYNVAFEGHPEVAKLEQDYSSYSYPVHEPKTPAQLREEMNPKFVAADETVTNSTKAVADLTERVQYLKGNMTHKYTTLEDTFKKYPGLEEWIDDELARHKWMSNCREKIS